MFTRQITNRLVFNQRLCQDPNGINSFGSRGDGWHVGQACYPFLVEPILVLNMQGHGIIYHCYTYQPEPLPERIEVVTSLPKNLVKLVKALAVAGVLFIAASYLPSAWFALTKGTGEAISRVLVKDVAEPGKSFTVIDKTFQPRFDAKITREARIKIPTLGVDTVIGEATADNYEAALKKGTWRVSDFGTPADRSAPTILAAHRYGYLVWSNTFRRKNSFYNLPKLKIGDTVEVYWKQRRYIYEVYAQSEGGEINDYSGDLILYTCEALNSPVRIFKYARLLEV